MHYILTAVCLLTSGEEDKKPPSVAGSNADVAASAAVSAVVEAASRQFSSELTTKIFELLCDESVSCLNNVNTVLLYYFNRVATVTCGLQSRDNSSVGDIRGAFKKVCNSI